MPSATSRSTSGLADRTESGAAAETSRLPKEGVRQRPRIVYLVTEDWYFCSHRLPMARAARALGWEVVVATRVDRHGDAIRAEGFRLVPLRLERRSFNPLSELRSVLEIFALYRRERPDLVHHVALKPVLYGGIAARLARVPAILNAIAGMGSVFTSGSVRHRAFRRFVLALFRFLFAHRSAAVLVQNEDDRAFLLAERLVRPERLFLLRGSGIDVQRFVPAPEPQGIPVVALVARMLWDKGIAEAVAAAELLRKRGVAFRLVLIGAPDPHNPTSIPEETLRGWAATGLAEWWGQRDDMAAAWHETHVALLPSYREGLPKSLLEAAACGRPLIATDVPGCRELVRHEVNGLLAPRGDIPALAAAIERLVTSPELRRRLGEAARDIVVADYADEVVAREIGRVYTQLAAIASQ